MKSPLESRTVTLYLIERKGGWLDGISEQHDGRGMYSNCNCTLTGIPEDQYGKKIDPLTDKEKEFFAEKFGWNKERFSIHTEDNYWKGFRIALGKKAMPLNLSNLDDCLKYKYLLSWVKLIAPDWESRYEDNFRFAFKENDFDMNTKVAKSEKKMQAYDFLREIKVSKEKMRGVLRILGVTPSLAASMTELEAQLIDVIDSNQIDRFLEVKEDQFLEHKILIEKGLTTGEIVKQGKNQYFVKSLEENFRFDELIEYLADKKNVEAFVKLKAVTDEKE